MLLGPKTKTQLFFRHFLVALFAAALLYGFWLSRPEWSPDMRLWRAFGDTGFILLFLVMIIGPLARIWSPMARFISWRRELGIWFFVAALTHGILIIDGWAQWEVMRFLGYDFLPQFDRYARVEPGFGLSNLMGLMALIFAMFLAATSSDKAVNYLGVSAWKWLHGFAYVIFYLTVLHVLYFLFIHYTVSFHRSVPPDPNWFRFPVLWLSLTVFVLQVWAFIKTVKKRRKSATSTPKSAKEIKTTIRSIKKIAEGTFEVSLVRPKGFEFVAGQHIQLVLPELKHSDPKGSSRVFSLCSSPDDKETLCVAFRDTGSGYKKTLLEMRAGASVYFEGPLGYFTLPKDSTKKNVFIAGGIGITPFMSIIQSALSENNPPVMHLLYANRSKESCAYLEELKLLSASSKYFSFDTIFGRIGPDDIDKHTRDINNTSWWVVGPPGMVAEVKRLLGSLGVSDENIRTEEFIGY